MGVKKVSVVMCTFNGAPYLREQLDTIINQTYPIFEIIIQDDGSTDSTMSILQDYEDRYPFIHVFKNEEQKGVNANFYSAIEKASGDYIAISDQDDIWELNKIEMQMATIGEKFLSSSFSKPFSEAGAEVFFDERIPNISIIRLIHIGSSMPGHTLLFKKDLFKLIPKDDFSNDFLYDHLFQLVAASYKQVSFCPNILVHNRRHLSAATYTSPTSDYKKNFRNALSTVKRTLSVYLEIRTKMQAHYKEVYKLLNILPCIDNENYNARQLALYQSQKGFISYAKLTFFCIKSRNKLFHTIESDNLLTILRAIYFPISCSDYFRYMSKSYK